MERLFVSPFRATQGCASVCSVVKLVLNHGRHRNASLCGAERAEKDGFHAIQPQSAPFKKSAYGRWALVSERVRSAAQRTLSAFKIEIKYAELQNQHPS